MNSWENESVINILWYLKQKNFNEAIRKLGQESGLFFDVDYFEDLLKNGNWDDVDIYLSSFTKAEDSLQSKLLFFELAKQKYFEALDKHDRNKAWEILNKNLKVNPGKSFDELARLLTKEDFREYEVFADYNGVKSLTSGQLNYILSLVVGNPVLKDKLEIPSLPVTLQDIESSDWFIYLDLYPRIQQNVNCPSGQQQVANPPPCERHAEQGLPSTQAMRPVHPVGSRMLPTVLSRITLNSVQERLTEN